MKNLRGSWKTSMVQVTNNSYHCGFCGSYAGPSSAYQCVYQFKGITYTSAFIYICPSCNKPTFLNDSEKEQVPGIRSGEKLEHLPENIEQLYEEARICLSVNANTSAVLSCRKLLMNVSVTKGAEEGKRFAYYVNFLEENHFIPPGSKDWVDHIRKKGNEATHEIPNIDQYDATELIKFTEMLLRFVYEFPGKMERHQK